MIGWNFSQGGTERLRIPNRNEQPVRSIRRSCPAIVGGVQEVDLVDIYSGQFCRLGKVELGAGINNFEVGFVFQRWQFDAIGLGIVEYFRQSNQFGDVVSGLPGQVKRPEVCRLVGVPVPPPLL